MLTRRRDTLAGNVKFIFQPAEEMAAGAPAMIEDGVLDDPAVDAIFAFHLWNSLPAGTVGLRARPSLGLRGPDADQDRGARRPRRDPPPDHRPHPHGVTGRPRAADPGEPRVAPRQSRRPECHFAPGGDDMERHTRRGGAPGNPAHLRPRPARRARRARRGRGARHLPRRAGGVRVHVGVPRAARGERQTR